MSFWSDEDPERYNPNDWQGVNARTFERGDINHAYDVNGVTAQGAQLNTNDYGQVRGRQMGLADTLNAASQGQGPSAAGVAGAQARDANLAQAVALQAGRRGANAAAGARMAGNQVAMGNQAAQGQETVGRINEMMGARGQYAGLLGNVAGQDIGVAGQNASLAQQAGQFNATQQQQAELANQAAQLGISTQELQARMEQERMRYGNLKPGQQAGWKDALGGGLAVAGTVAGGYAGRHMKDGGYVAGPHPMANGGYAGSMMGIGQREAPNWYPQTAENAIVAGLVGGLGAGLSAYDTAKTSKEAKARQAKLDAQSAEDRRRSDERWQAFMDMNRPVPPPVPTIDPSYYGALASPDDIRYRVGGPLTPYAKGGAAFDGPTRALVGEAGPELILGPGGGRIVNRPTVTTLGARGGELVVPLSEAIRKATEGMRKNR